MGALNKLLNSNKNWSARIRAGDPEFFSSLSKQQAPHYLWIGCSDSRVPANQIVDMQPGEIFVHRNVANVVVHTDFNCLSVIQYAVEVLKVQHIIVCGHYGCGGVQASLGDTELGLIDNWLRHIIDVQIKHAAELAEITDQCRRLNRLCELNVIEQVRNVCHTTIAQQAWRTGQPLAVHGWIYDLNDGIITDLEVSVESLAGIDQAYLLARGVE